MTPSRKGGVDLQGQFGGAATFTEFTEPAGGGGGVLHVEPFVAPAISFPIGLGVGGVTGPTGAMPFRVGVRHRVFRHLAYGFGIGPSLAFGAFGLDVAGVADMELVAGLESRRVGFSAAIRPAISFVSGFVTFFALFEPSLAFHVGRRTAITFALVAGPWISGDGDNEAIGGFFGAALGIHRRF